MTKAATFRSHCCVCDKPISRDHKCDPKTLARRDSAMKVDRLDTKGAPMTFDSRLSQGFLMLGLGEDAPDEQDGARFAHSISF